MITIMLILATAAVVALIAAFAAVVLGIQLAERRKSPPGSSRNCADAFARRVLHAEISQSGVRRCSSHSAAHSQRRKVADHAR